MYFLPLHVTVTEMALFFVLILHFTFFLIMLDIICEQSLKVGSAGLEDWLAIGSRGEVVGTEHGSGGPRSAVSSPVSGSESCALIALRPHADISFRGKGKTEIPFSPL